MKNQFKCVIFIIITAVLFAGISSVLNPPGMWDEYKAENKNSIDVLFFGSSHMYCAVNPVTIWQEAGIASYVVGAPEQPMSGIYHYILEAFKTQKPKLVAIELYSMVAFENPYPVDEFPNQIKDIESMPTSINKLKAIMDTTKKSEWIPLIFNIYSTHSRWKELGKEDYLKEISNVDRSVFKGHRPVYEELSEPYKEPDTNNPPKYIHSEGNMQYLKQSIKYCIENGAEVLLFVTPAAMKMNDESYDRIASEIKNADYLNINDKVSELHIDNENDWSDNYGHFNARGARKVSAYLARHLKENYNLSNKKGDPQYKDFILEYERILEEETKK